MFDKGIYYLHHIELPEGYECRPSQHLYNPRDNQHFIRTLKLMDNKKYTTLLDIGSWDGWLPLLLGHQNKTVTALEWVPDLSTATDRYAIYHFLPVTAMNGDFLYDTIQFGKSEFDLVTAYEVLEHIPIELVPKFIDKMNAVAQTVMISLPNQDHNENGQHRWTPTEKLIRELFEDTQNLVIDYHEYLQTPIPGNWFIQYDTKRC